MKEAAPGPLAGQLPSGALFLREAHRVGAPDFDGVDSEVVRKQLDGDKPGPHFFERAIL